MKKGAFACIGIIVVLALILLALFIPWYSTHMKQTTMGTETDYRNDLYLNRAEMKEISMGQDKERLYFYEDMKREFAPEHLPINLDIFSYMMYLTVGALGTSILALIGVLRTLRHFEDANKMRRVVRNFGFITFILILLATYYFLISKIIIFLYTSTIYYLTIGALFCGAVASILVLTGIQGTLLPFKDVNKMRRVVRNFGFITFILILLAIITSLLSYPIIGIFEPFFWGAGISMLALTGVRGTLLHFGNSNKMRILATVFSVITFILAFFAIIYFMTNFSVNITGEIPWEYYGFWFTDTINEAKVSGGPGIAWFSMIVAGIIAVISSVVIFKTPVPTEEKKRKEITKTIKCPSCGETTKIYGVPGERVTVICPKCNTKGFFQFR